VDVAARFFISQALPTLRPLDGQLRIFKPKPLYRGSVVFRLERKDAFFLAWIANQKIARDAAAQVVNTAFAVALKPVRDQMHVLGGSESHV
jgi:hypothetical protein